MTDLLDKAFAAAAKLPREAQDALAQQLLDEIASERAWESAFGDSLEELATLADEALGEHVAGRTLPLDPKAL